MIFLRIKFYQIVHFEGNRTWIYVTRVAEYYYYTTALVKPFTNWQKCEHWKADMAGFEGAVVQLVRPPGYGPDRQNTSIS